MNFKLLMENWRTFVNELHRNDIDRKAKSHGGSEASPENNPDSPYIPFIGHNYRTKSEIEDGTIKLVKITDGGVMLYSIVPYDSKRRADYGQYQLAVQFVNWAKIVKSTLTTKQKTQLLLKNELGETDQIKMHCTCPSFKYHYNSVAAKQGVAIMPNAMQPGQGKTGRLANPGQAGITCKHGRRIIQVFPNYYSEVYSKIKELEGGDEEPVAPVSAVPAQDSELDEV